MNMTIEDISKYENQTVTVMFNHKPFKSMTNSVKWSTNEADFPIYRGKIAKRITTDHNNNEKIEWLLCNNFIGDTRLRVLTDFSTRGGYNHVMELTPTVLMYIKNIKENRNI